MGRNEKKRYDFIDLLKGAGIFLVVWGHTVFPRSVYIYSFHMPLFFFLSGFLHNTKKPPHKFIIGKINTLYIPYAVFTLFSWVFYLILLLAQKNYDALNAHFIKISSLVTGTANNGGNNPIWFLTCLFVVSNAFLLISRINNPLFRFGSVVGASLVGYILSLTEVRLYFFNIDIALSALVFYYGGYIVRRRNLLRYIEPGRSRLWVLSMIPAEIAHIGTAYLNTRVAAIDWVNMAGNTLGNYFFFYASAFLGILVYFVAGCQIQRLGILNFLGKNSLLILATHKPLLFLFDRSAGKFLNPEAGWYGLLATITVLLSTLPLILLVNRKAPLIIGKPIP